MKVARTPEDCYYNSVCVLFTKSRKDGELYYEIILWYKDATQMHSVEKGKVKDKDHLKELQSMETVKDE